MLIVERFVSSLINKYGKYPILTADGGTWYPSQAFKFLKLKHQGFTGHKSLWISISGLRPSRLGDLGFFLYCDFFLCIYLILIYISLFLFF